MSFIGWILVGLIAGWASGKIMKGSGYGLIGNIIVGVIGACLGGWLFGIIGIQAHTTLGSIVTAIVGAIVLISIVRVVRN